MDFYIKKLNDFKPIIIEGYPSALYVMAQGILSSNLKLSFTPKLILSTAESLQVFQKETIEAAFGAKVRNYYGSSDGIPLIMECPNGNLHTVPESGIFEFLDDNGHAVKPYQIGELVATTLFSKAQPVIRYRTADMMTIRSINDKCSCGSKGLIIEQIDGRKDDLIYSEERGWVGRLSQLPKLLPSRVIECQFVQEVTDLIIIRVVVKDNEEISAQELEQFDQDFSLRLGQKMKYKIKYVDKIERGSNNKFKFVISKIKPQATCPNSSE